MMNSRPNLMISLSSIIIIFFFSCSYCLASEFIKYPGNGIPYFSKNKPIKELNNEIEHHIKDIKGIKYVNGKMSFKDISEFRFKSGKGISGPRYCIKVPLSIEKGSCIIKIGDVSYKIDNENFSAINSGQMIFESKKEKPIDIIVTVFSKSNSATSFHSEKRLMDVVNVNFAEPLFISIFLEDNCSGWIGPWEWIRGLE